MKDTLSNLVGFSKFGNIPPSEYWAMTWEERRIIADHLSEILKEEAKIKANRDSQFLKAIAKIVAGAFGKR